jgi:hypothetical protein
MISWTPKTPKRRTAIVAVVTMAALVGASIGVFALAPQGARASGSGGGSCSPASVSSCSFKGNSASVSFESWDASGCLRTAVSVFASEGFTHTPPGGQEDTGAGTTVSLFQFNFCTGDFSQYIQAFGTSEDTVFKAPASLDTASATGTAILTDFGANYGAQLTATFDVTWKGTGNITNTIDSMHLRGLNYSTHVHVNADSRIAIATGSIVVSGVNYVTAPGFGSLFRSKGSTIQVTSN